MTNGRKQAINTHLDRESVRACTGEYLKAHSWSTKWKTMDAAARPCSRHADLKFRVRGESDTISVIFPHIPKNSGPSAGLFVLPDHLE
jgi:hypothetical protein